MNINLIDAMVLGMGFVFGATIASIILSVVGFIILLVLSLFGVLLVGG
jgi:hypothetical protein